MTAVCPHCGKPVTLTKSSVSQWQPVWQPAGQFQMAVSTPWQQGSAAAPAIAAPPMATDATRRAPARAATMESDVFVPLSQSFATGIALLVPGIGLSLWLKLPWWTPLAISGSGIALTWLYLLDAHRRLLWLVETISHYDLDGDGQAGRPEPEPEEITLHIRHEDQNGRAPYQQRLPLPKGVSRKMLVDFATRYRIAGLSQDSWTGKGKPFSRPQYISFMTTLREAGIAEWVNPHNHSQGHYITRGGRAALAYLAKND